MPPASRSPGPAAGSGRREAVLAEHGTPVRDVPRVKPAALRPQQAAYVDVDVDINVAGPYRPDR